MDRVRDVIAAHPQVSRWAISGHSLGGALACRMVQSDPQAFSAMVLVGTTHPKLDDPVLSCDASDEGLWLQRRRGAAGADVIQQETTPEDTQWVEIDGGNHSQFGHYGHQLFDGKATTSREAQQAATRSAILEALRKIMP